MDKRYSYDDLLNIIETLRGENGCPWDKEQTHQSLVQPLIEESYEAVEAIQNDDMTLLREELGDVLLQVVMHSQIAKEEGNFTMADVVSDIAAKMVHRHPHVFGEGEKDVVKNSEEVLKQWDEIKQAEKKEKTVYDSLDRVAKSLPALMRTQKIQKKAMKSGALHVDRIEQIDGVIALLESLKNEDIHYENHELEDKFGKIMFQVVILSTFFDINAEFTLTKSLEKFINRFRYIENSTFE